MKYKSTRGDEALFSGAQVIKQGIAPDGGLFVPESIPVLTQDKMRSYVGSSYSRIAADILAMYLDDYSNSELLDYCEKAYDSEKFGGEDPAPLVQLNSYNEREYILELWHGPTAAFKDMALQLLPHLMTAALLKTGERSKICILTATSGDTGKAALEGFKDVPQTEIVVFYPEDGVSEMQKLQMITTTGVNVHVAAVEGSFDDTQNAVKRIFADEEIENDLKNEAILLSSANSINWGRLVPQIVYYVASYVRLMEREKLEYPEPVNIVVPTGNFGNILAAWYARQMGIPIHKLICASNKNKVLSDFFRTGVYDRNREFFKTNAPSMDILISSNLERLLYEMSDHDGIQVAKWMTELQKGGKYEVQPKVLRQLQNFFVGGFADDSGTIKTIREVYDRCDHVVDTHTAVGFNVYSRYYQRSGDETKTIFVSTASPFKFPDVVSESLFSKAACKDKSDADMIRELSEESSLPVPGELRNIHEKPVLHRDVIEKTEMKRYVWDCLCTN